MCILLHLHQCHKQFFWHNEFCNSFFAIAFAINFFEVSSYWLRFRSMFFEKKFLFCSLFYGFNLKQCHLKYYFSLKTTAQPDFKMFILKSIFLFQIYLNPISLLTPTKRCWHHQKLVQIYRQCFNFLNSIASIFFKIALACSMFQLSTSYSRKQKKLRLITKLRPKKICIWLKKVIVELHVIVQIYC